MNFKFDVMSEGITHDKTKNLRIVIVSDSAPQRNGVGSYYYDLSQHLKEYVKSIDILSPQIIEGQWHGGVPLPLPGDHTQRFLIPNFYTLRNQMKSLHPDVVIIPTPGFYGLTGARLGKSLGARVLVGFHTKFDTLTDMYWSRMTSHVSRQYLTFTNRLLFYHADCVLVNSDSMKKNALSHGAKSVILVGTPLPYDFIHKPVAPLSQDIKIVFFAGRLAAEKNISALIESAKKLPNLTFNFAGDGPEKSKVENAANTLPNVNYVGWLDRDQLLTHIDKSDLVALPSHVESFGTIALEAMARQRYTLVSENCGIAQWPELTHGFFLFKFENPLSHALERILSMPPDERLTIAQKGRKLALALNRWNCEHWLTLFNPETC